MDAFDADIEPLRCIQRLGTGLHCVLPNFRSSTFGAANQRTTQCLGFSDPRITQSPVVTKAAANGAKVIPHQDGCSSFTNPPSCVTFWYALEDTAFENGCLKAIHGSHRIHPIRRRCVADGTGRPQFRDLDVSIYMPVSGTPPSKLTKNEEIQNLEILAGTLILMHGNLVYASEPNHSSKNGIAFNLELSRAALRGCRITTSSHTMARQSLRS